MGWSIDDTDNLYHAHPFTTPLLRFCHSTATPVQTVTIDYRVGLGSLPNTTLAVGAMHGRNPCLQQQRHLHSIYPDTRDEPGNFADEWKEIFAEEYRDMMMGPGDVDQNYEEPFSGKLVVVEDWPVNDLQLGQVGGVATDPEGYLHVFHRADRTWEARSVLQYITLHHKIIYIRQCRVFVQKLFEQVLS